MVVLIWLVEPVLQALEVTCCLKAALRLISHHRAVLCSSVSRTLSVRLVQLPWLPVPLSAALLALSVSSRVTVLISMLARFPLQLAAVLMQVELLFLFVLVPLCRAAAQVVLLT